jgi:hypothetical protein
MNVPPTTLLPRRGTELLLWHCGALSRPSPAERLSEELGDELSRRLVQVLAPSYPFGRRALGSSSP